MYRHQDKVISREIHPIWRGIGCVFGVVVLGMSYIASDLVIQANTLKGWIAVPASLSQPLFTLSVSIPYLGVIPSFDISYFYLRLPITAILSLLLFSIFSIIYYFVYKAGGGGHHDPRDVPQLRRKGGKKRKLRQD